MSDDCDLSHCSACGCHFVEPYADFKFCQACDELTPEEQDEIKRQAIKAWQEAMTKNAQGIKVGNPKV
jgi:hypothetical protein